jgi:hypothetical protein
VRDGRWCVECVRLVVCRRLGIGWIGLGGAGGAFAGGGAGWGCGRVVRRGGCVGLWGRCRSISFGRVAALFNFITFILLLIFILLFFFKSLLIIYTIFIINNSIRHNHYYTHQFVYYFYHINFNTIYF